MTEHLGGCKILELPLVEDARGALTFIQSCEQVPFTIERVFYLYRTGLGSKRGEHAHAQLQLMLIALNGCLDVVLDDGNRQERVRLTRPSEGLYIPPMIWHTVENLSPGAVCLALASARFDEADYYRDYNAFRAVARSPR